MLNRELLSCQTCALIYGCSQPLEVAKAGDCYAMVLLPSRGCRYSRESSQQQRGCIYVAQQLPAGLVKRMG